MDALPFTMDQVQYYLLILVRISTMIALLPIFGGQQVPVQLKAGFALLLSIIIFITLVPAGKLVAPQPLTIGLLILLIIKEAVVGLAVGFASSFLFTAVQFAGRLVDTEIGFGFVEIADPFSDEMVTALGQFQIILFTILFLLFNGHYFLLIAMQRSFDLIPLTAAHFPGGPMSKHITEMIGTVFIIAFKLAAPIYVTLILTELAMGIVARTVPQINIFFVGLPLKIIVGLGTAFLVLPMLATLFKSMVEKLMQDIWKLLYLMA
jgi:flagellar biosynthesis protein FliR